jgi:hypothetical protein
MIMGPITQFWTSDSAKTRQLRKNLGSSSYFTLASGGYIIRIRPMAIGMDVVPTERRLIKSAVAGTKYPRPTPNTIARIIHKDKKRSTKESLGPHDAGI